MLVVQLAVIDTTLCQSAMPALTIFSHVDASAIGKRLAAPAARVEGFGKRM
jgi:hypothetical protein